MSFATEYSIDRRRPTDAPSRPYSFSQETALDLVARPLCLWLADDQEEIRALIAETLNKSGMLHCARVFSCAELLLDALAKETPPDAILLDINMGGMTGIEAIAPIKRLAGATRVFIMTTFYDSHDASCARDAGAAGFFLKSSDWQRIIERLVDTSPRRRPEDAVPAMKQRARKEADFESAAHALSPAKGNGASGRPRNSQPARVQDRFRPLFGRGLALARSIFARSPWRQTPAPR